MGLETGTYINSLDADNPLGSDGKSAGDDHIRLLKSTIKATFPNVTGAITPTQTELNYVAGVTSLIQTQLNGLSTNKQAAHDNLTAESGLTGAADKLSYYTGLGAKALTSFFAWGRSFLGAADVAAARTVLAAQEALVSGTNIKTVGGESLLGSGDVTVGPTLGTAVAAASQTSIDFTGIPAGVNRITVMLYGLSLSSTSYPRFQLGDAGGVETSGYVGYDWYDQGGGGSAAFSAGFDSYGVGSAAAQTLTGKLVLDRVDGNKWEASGMITADGTAINSKVIGRKELSGELDRVRVTTASGTDTFDAGSVNISYE